MSYNSFNSCVKVICLVSSLLVLQALHAQPDWTDFESRLSAEKKLLGNDFVALIWNGDSISYKKEFGDFNAKTQVPIASASKWLTAALVMKMVEEGKIGLDDKVVRYIPELDKYFKGYITVRQCLSHKTGIKDEGGLLKKMLQRKKFESLEEEVNSFASRDIRANAGNDFWYGNIGLNMAGRVLEIVSKKKFDALAKQKLFTPVGMKKTTFTTLDGGAPNPSGGALSTAEDYLKFLTMLLNRGKVNGVQYLSEESVELMREVQNDNVPIAYAPKSAEGFKYALGAWVIAKEKTAAGAPNKASVLASPGLFGTWPMIDYCRGYAYLVFVKNLLSEERATVHLELRSLIEEQLKSKCE